MKINGTFKLAILKRFLTKEELEELQTAYDEAKILVLGNKAIKKQSYSRHIAIALNQQDDE